MAGVETSGTPGLGSKGKLAQRWILAHCRSHSLPVLVPGGTVGGGSLRFRVGARGCGEFRRRPGMEGIN